MNFLRRLGRSIRRNGVMGTAALAARVAQNSLRDLNPQRRQALEAGMKAEQDYDRAYNVDTAGLIHISEFQVDRGSADTAHSYQGVGAEQFHAILRVAGEVAP